MLLLIDEVSELPDDLTESQKQDALAWLDVAKYYTQWIEQAAAHYDKHHDQDDD